MYADCFQQQVSIVALIVNTYVSFLICTLFGIPIFIKKGIVLNIADRFCHVSGKLSDIHELVLG